MAWKSLLLLALVVGATAVDLEDSNTCQDCRSLVSLATRFNSSTHRQAYMELIKGFCEQYYPPSTDFQQGPCPIFVQSLFYVMDNTDPVAHCDDIGACGPKQPSDDIYQYLQSSNNVADATSRGADEAVCDFCQNLLEQFKATLTNPRAVQMIYDRMDQLCDYLKVVDQDKVCREFVSKYLKFFVRLIQKIDTKEYCASIQMCPKRSRRASTEQIRLPTLADFNNFGLETSVSIGAKPTDLASTDHKMGPTCIICKTMVKEMFIFLRENKTEENIVKGLAVVCHMIYPKEPNLGECKSLVKAYTREIVQLLIDETDPTMICTLLGQCVFSAPQRQLTAKPEVVAHDQDHDLAHLITALEPNIGIKSLEACVECKMFIKFLKDKLNNPRSQAELEQWLLDNLCRQLPDTTLVQSCSKMVQNYANVFFQAVAGDLNPQKACTELGVCNSRAPVQVFFMDSLTKALEFSPDQAGVAAPSRMMSKERRCTRCTDVVSFIDEYLAAHPMSEDIVTASKVCTNTDNSLIRSECMDIVKQHGTDIVQMIPTMESPRHLCQLISLC